MCRLVIILLLMLLGTGGQDAWGQLSGLKFSDPKVTRVVPKGFRAVNGTAQVVVKNDTVAFTMSNISGTVWKKGKKFVNGTAEPVSVPEGTSTVVVNGNAALCEGVTVWDVLGCIVFRAADYSIDVSMTIVDSRGTVKHYAREGIGVAALLKGVRGKKR